MPYAVCDHGWSYRTLEGLASKTVNKAVQRDA